MKKSYFVIVFLLLGYFGNSQDKKGSLEIKTYIDGYYAYFDDDQGTDFLQSYTTVSARDRQFSLNIAQVGFHYEAKDVRANMTLHHGDIAKATWSNRFANVQEANVGVHLFPNWWLDIGLFTTHIGTESFLPKNNYLSSTAVLTYNEPFYQAGAKLAYEGSDKYDLEFWVTNGYNLFRDVNKDKSYGLLFNYNINKNTSITYTNLTGNEQSYISDKKQLRSYHNLYLNMDIKNKILLTIGADYGVQTNTGPNDEMASMFGGLATIRAVLTNEFSMTFRQEIFVDEEGFISGPVDVIDTVNEGLQITGSTLGIEYKMNKNSYLRGETRYIQSLSDNAILFNNSSLRNRWEFMTTCGYYFDKKW